MTWLWDWDHMISPARVLRQYLFEHGTIPFWNFYLCGGQFELQNPQSFTFTWPSLLYYLIHPAAAIMVLWALLTAAGTLAMARLLELAGSRSWIAWSCAVAFTFSGYFGAHFNQGHATFSFFHLVLLLCWLTAREWRLQFDSGKSRLIIPPIVLASFLLFSAPAIQTMVYAFPAFLVIAAFLFWPVKRPSGAPRERNGFASGVIISMIFGIFSASYKFFPVLFQSLSRRRDDIFLERYPPDILFKTMFTFVLHPHRMWQEYKAPERMFGWWEYAAFISPVLVGLALMAPVVYFAARLFRRGMRHSLVESEVKPSAILHDRLMISGLLLMMMGALLCLGNGFWLDATNGARVGGPLAKILQSVRVFPRFQFLSLFGAAICGGLCLELLVSRRAFLNLIPARVMLLLLIAGPSVVQAAIMIHSIEAIPDRFMEERFGLKSSFDEMARGKNLLLSNRILLMPGIISAQDLMVRHGVVVAECYDQFFPIKQEFQLRAPDLLRPMTTPRLARLEKLTGRAFDLSIPSNLDQNIIFNLALVQDAKVTPQPMIGPRGMEFDRASVAGKSIHVEFPVDDAVFGALVSMVSLIAVLGIYLRERRYPK